MIRVILGVSADFSKKPNNPVLRRMVSGKELSNHLEIKLNKVDEKLYTILFPVEEFKLVQPVTLFRYAAKVIEGYFKGKKVNFSILVIYANQNDTQLCTHLLELDDLFYAFDLPNIEYETSNSLVEFLGEDYPIEHGDLEEEEETENFVSTLSKAAKKKGKKKKKKKDKKERYSKLMDEGKKNIKAHNILVSPKDNKDFKHDAKVVKGFLKEFIPQKSKWAKRYRNELLQRWMSVFVITPKMAKKIKKASKVKVVKRSGRDELFYDATK